MYKIQTTTACAFTLSGTPATNVTVTITTGYNWFGYTGAQPLALDNLNFSPAQGDKIISQNEDFAIYENGAWNGALSSLQSGHGYVYFSNAVETKALEFQ